LPPAQAKLGALAPILFFRTVQNEVQEIAHRILLDGIEDFDHFCNPLLIPTVILVSWTRKIQSELQNDGIFQIAGLHRTQKPSGKKGD
jgi:hypothetical protein